MPLKTTLTYLVHWLTICTCFGRTSLFLYYMRHWLRWFNWAKKLYPRWLVIILENKVRARRCQLTWGCVFVLLKKNLKLCLLVYFVGLCRCAYTWGNLCRRQRAVCGIDVSPSTIWILQLNSSHQAWSQGASPTEPSLLGGHFSSIFSGLFATWQLCFQSKSPKRMSFVT